jgi:hypothetical protein
MVSEKPLSESKIRISDFPIANIYLFGIIKLEYGTTIFCLKLG